MAQAPQYNMALDLLMLAGKEARKGNAVNASTLLIRAASTSDFGAALRMVEATNAFALEAATKGQGKKISAKAKRVKANDEEMDIPFEETDEETEEVLRQGIDADFEGDVDGDGDIDGDDFEELEDDEEDEEVEEVEVEEEVEGKVMATAFARVLATMRQAQPAKTSKRR